MKVQKIALFNFLILVVSAIHQVPAQNLRLLLSGDSTLVFAHRAVVKDNLPENSISGTRQALVDGVNKLEIDVRESKDGILYLLHDETLDRTTTGKGILMDWESDHLDTLFLLGSNDRLPRFDAYLNSIRNERVYLMLDVKEAPIAKVIQLVAENEMLDRIVLLTFQMDRASEAFALNDRFLVSVLINSEEEFDDYLCKSTDPYHVAVYLNKDAGLGLYVEAQKLGLPIITDVMGIIDNQGKEDHSIYREFVQKRKPNVVVSDYPKKLQQAIF
jgi:glycerophosphoryl diester phosphodiesterase